MAHSAYKWIASAAVTTLLASATAMAEAESMELILLATTVSDAPDRFRATLKDAGQEARYVIQVGESLPGSGDLTVTSIEEDRVQVAGGSGETSYIDLAENVTLASAMDVPTLADMQAPMREGNISSLYTGIAALHFARIGARDLDALGGQGVFTPEPAASGNEMDGLRVIRITEGGFYDQLGLAAGDVIYSVNNQRLDSSEATRQAVESFLSDTEISLMIQGPEGEGHITLTTNTVPVE